MPAIALSSALVGGFAHTANKESPASYMPVVANAFAASVALIGALYDLSSASDAPVMPSGRTSDSVETFFAPGRTDSNSPAWMRRNSSACTHGTTESQMTGVASSPGVSRMSLPTSGSTGSFAGSEFAGGGAWAIAGIFALTAPASSPPASVDFRFWPPPRACVMIAGCTGIARSGNDCA